MAIARRFCGRRFRHPEHNWKEPSISAGYESWPEFSCHGITEGPTEQEYLRGARPSAPIEIEESWDDAMRRYAGRIERIKKFINDTDGEDLIRADELRKILEEDE
jgi:hypothetical protein